MNTKTEIYLPSIALFLNDLRSRIEMLEPARERGFKTGLMLIIRGPQDLEAEAIEKQLTNLNQLDLEDNPCVFVMHPNMPLSGPRRFNLLDNPDWSEEYVRKSVDLAAAIPEELIPPSGQMVTFHLNTLVSPKDWVNDRHYWEGIFRKVLSRIKRLVDYASSKKVALALETTPIPEFGDVLKDEKHKLENGVFWSDLGNPWPLFPWRGEIAKLRETGAHIKFDFSHSFIALNTLKEINRLAARGKKQDALKTYKVFEEDPKLNLTDDFSSLILDATKDGDAWDVNDGLGLYKTIQLQGRQEYFKEGVTLFEGDIPESHLERLIKEGLKRQIKFIIEVNETDFATSPNSKKTLARVLELV